eukprot:g16666.t1
MSSLFTCFAGLLGPDKKKKILDERRQSPSWATLPVPVSNEIVAAWLPVSLLQQNARCVLFFHLGSFDLLSLELSGCTRRDLLFICEEKLAELQLQDGRFPPGLQEAKISVVVDLHRVKLRQLNSHWWKMLAPRLLQLVDKRFPGPGPPEGRGAAAEGRRNSMLQPMHLKTTRGTSSGSAPLVVARFLEELLFVRADRLTSLAAERLLSVSRPQDLRDLIVLGGDELSAVEEARKRRTEAKRRRRCCRWSCTAILCFFVLFLLEASGLLAGVATWEWPNWSQAQLISLCCCLAASLWFWAPTITLPKDGLSEDTAQLLVLLLGSPIAWAAALRGVGGSGRGVVQQRLRLRNQAAASAGFGGPMLAALAPAALVVLGLHRVFGHAVWRQCGSPAKKARLNLAGQAQDSRRQSNAWWPELTLGNAGEPHFLGTAKGMRRHLPPVAGDAVRMLARLQQVSKACRQASRDGRPQLVQEISVQQVAAEEGRTVWYATVQNDPVIFVTSEVFLATNQPWDSKAFKVYEVLGTQVQQSTQSFCDFLYCRVPVLPGVKDRDMVQERFLMKLPGEQGLVWSREYILRPHPAGGVVLLGLSQTDMGGNVPQWVQSFAKKAGKRMPLQWAQSLEGDFITRRGVCAISSIMGMVTSAVEALHKSKVEGEDIAAVQIGRQGFTVSIFPGSHELYGPQALEGIPQPILANPPWAIGGPVAGSRKHFESLARAMKHKSGAALVASPLAMAGYAARILEADKGTAMDVSKIGIVVATTAAAGAEPPVSAEGGATPPPRGKTTRYLYVSYGGMPLPSPDVGEMKASIVRIILDKASGKTVMVVIKRARGAPAFAGHRQGRSGHARDAQLLRSHFRAVVAILGARGSPPGAVAAESAASHFNAEIARMGSDRLSASFEYTF